MHVLGKIDYLNILCITYEKNNVFEEEENGEYLKMFNKFCYFLLINILAR